MNQNELKRILHEIESGYDLVSDKFSQTRFRFWRDLGYVKKYIRDGDRVLDFGCGNGRLLEIIGNKNIEYNGVDISGKLIEIAKQKYQGNHVAFRKISSSPSLSFEDNFFNATYAIAVFHHFPGREYQLRWAKEIYRVTKPGGRCVITVWNLWQKKYMFLIFKNWLDKILGKSQMDWNDTYISFTDNKGIIFQRYHHAFTQGELSYIFQQAGFKILTNKKAGRNLVVVGEKLAG